MTKISIKVVLAFLTTILFLSAHYLHTLFYLGVDVVFFGINMYNFLCDIALVSAIGLQIILLLIIIKDCDPKD